MWYRWKNRVELPPHELQSLRGRSVVLTGGTSGIGRATVEGLLALGAHVVVGSRNADRGRALLEKLDSEGGRLEVVQLDLADPRSVEGFASEARTRALRETGAIHAIINSAAEIRCAPELTPGGVDATFASNHLGPQHLLECLLPELTKGATQGHGGSVASTLRPRVVLLGSRLERRGLVDLQSLETTGMPDPSMSKQFDPMRNYGASKLANMHLALELRRRLGDLPVDVLVVSPGMVNTGLWGNFPLWYRTLTYPVRAALLRSPKEAAQGVLFAVAAREAEGTAHRYLCDGKSLESSEAAKDAVLARALFDLCSRLTEREREARMRQDRESEHL